jgi:hypothetical protein
MPLTSSAAAGVTQTPGRPRAAGRCGRGSCPLLGVLPFGLLRPVFLVSRRHSSSSAPSSTRTGRRPCPTSPRSARTSSGTPTCAPWSLGGDGGARRRVRRPARLRRRDRRPDGVLRRVVTAACGVLAQFGGVMLAFAFIATVGFQGLRHRLLASSSTSTSTGVAGCSPAARPDPRLHLLPDPAHGHRLPARARRAAAAVARGRATLGGRRGTSGATSAPAAVAGLPRRRCSCSSPTPSPPTRRRRRSSARASPIVPLKIRGDHQRGDPRRQNLGKSPSPWAWSSSSGS